MSSQDMVIDMVICFTKNVCEEIKKALPDYSIYLAGLFDYKNL